MTTHEARQRLNITVDLIPEGNSNRPGTPLQPRKITIHNTDNAMPGANARAHAIYQKGPDAREREVSWHFTVDDGSVYQSLPVRERGWHAGAGNAVSIAIEICENAGIDHAAANDRAALLTAVLLKEHGLTPAADVVQHHAWTEKNCPHLLRVGNRWERFLDAVAGHFGQLEDSAGDECTLCGEGAAPMLATPDALGPEFAPDEGHGTSNPNLKPPVNTSRRSPFHSARNAEIDTVVMHFTDGGTLASVVSHFENNNRQVSAHYVIGRDGRIFQMVDDDRRANHCRGANRKSIGIEHVARPNERMSPEQERASIALVRYLHRQYEIPLANITGQRFAPLFTGGTGGTDCPHSLFGPRTRAAIEEWVQRNIAPETSPEMGGLAGVLESGVFRTEPASAGNDDGASTTTGLAGTTSQPEPGVTVIDAVETLTARRGEREFGPRQVRQVRTTRSAVTLVEQGGYCWGDRTLPSAELIENHPGFGAGAATITGKATYFGKYDDADEGTGTPAFKIVQSNSSVFGVSLPQATLLAHGLAERVNNRLRATELGLSALIEVYFPDTRRLARLPLVDVGPGAGTGAKADIAVAAMAWLQGEPEEKAKGFGLENVDVEIRLT